MLGTNTVMLVQEESRTCIRCVYISVPEEEEDLSEPATQVSGCNRTSDPPPYLSLSLSLEHWYMSSAHNLLATKRWNTRSWRHKSCIHTLSEATAGNRAHSKIFQSGPVTTYMAWQSNLTLVYCGTTTFQHLYIMLKSCVIEIHKCSRSAIERAEVVTLQKLELHRRESMFTSHGLFIVFSDHTLLHRLCFHFCWV